MIFLAWNNCSNQYGIHNNYTKGISMIKAHVNEQNVLHFTYPLAVQLTISLNGQLTLETFWIF